MCCIVRTYVRTAAVPRREALEPIVQNILVLLAANSAILQVELWVCDVPYLFREDIATTLG
jgi:hypothetical protein